MPPDLVDVHAHIAALNKFSLFDVRAGLFPTGNVRATTSTPKQSRSESCIVVNPRNSKNLIGASKKFLDPNLYHFTLAPIFSFDGGQTWGEAVLPMKPGWDGMTDPALAFDDFGNAFLVGEPLKFNPPGSQPDLTGLGMVVFRSTDGGKTWQPPIQLTTDTTDDKQWVVCDCHPHSPHYGNVYVAWGASSPLRFARSVDYGVTWTGTAGKSPGSPLVAYSFAPELSVSSDGALHILWHGDGGITIRYLRSTDGGASFEPVRTVVSGMESLRGNLPQTAQWPHFDLAKFRVITLVTDCAVQPAISAKSVIIVAWADMREGFSRIYYRRSDDGGTMWLGPESGTPLLPQVNFGGSHCFHPQIIATGTGVIGCAYYLFGPEPGGHRIRVQIAGSWDHGKSFSDFVTVTDRPWDPLVNAPFAHGDPNVHFIGEYFGLDADAEDFHLLWTDTRTGVQELFFDRVATKKVTSRHIPEIASEVLAGVTSDGGGLIIVGGKIVKVPPRSPLIKAMEALVVLEAAERASSSERRTIQQSARRLLAGALQELPGEMSREARSSGTRTKAPERTKQKR
jgi:hypothetical protein